MSTPLNPLSSEMRALAARCVEFSIATAFVTRGAIDDIVGAAIEAKARIRFLTGTFGNNTRQSTFRHLLSLSKRNAVQVRIWRSERHSNLHTKLYVWELPNKRGVAWIGSSNFTDGGLQAEGELILEVRSSRHKPVLRQLRAAFEREWARGVPLTSKFVDQYRESPRPPPDASVKTMKRPAPALTFPRGSMRYLTSYASTHYEDDGRAMRRVNALLGGTAGEYWLRTTAAQARRAKAGDRLLLVDLVDDTVALGAVTDVAVDGMARVLAYEPVVRGREWRRWSPELQRRAAKAGGFRPRGRALGTRWLSPDRARAIVAEIYPGKRIR